MNYTTTHSARCSNSKTANYRHLRRQIEAIADATSKKKKVLDVDLPYCMPRFSAKVLATWFALEGCSFPCLCLYHTFQPFKKKKSPTHKYMQNKKWRRSNGLRLQHATVSEKQGRAFITSRYCNSKPDPKFASARRLFKNHKIQTFSVNENIQ